MKELSISLHPKSLIVVNFVWVIIVLHATLCL